ncbi:hypothetical protein LguiB_027252 [Lonicera macranthoides]
MDKGFGPFGICCSGPRLPQGETEALCKRYDTNRCDLPSKIGLYTPWYVAIVVAIYRLYCLRKHLKGEANVIEQVAIVTSKSAIWNCDIERWPPWRRSKARGRVLSITSAPRPQIT